jgi:uncharacterized protein YceK
MIKFFIAFAAVLASLAGCGTVTDKDAQGEIIHTIDCSKSMATCQQDMMAVCTKGFTLVTDAQTRRNEEQRTLNGKIRYSCLKSAY